MADTIISKGILQAMWNMDWVRTLLGLVKRWIQIKGGWGHGLLGGYGCGSLDCERACCQGGRGKIGVVGIECKIEFVNAIVRRENME